LDGLILPGGESTTQLAILQEEGLYEQSRKFAAEDQSYFRHVRWRDFAGHRSQKSTQESLGLLDMTVLRNGYGRQVIAMWSADPYLKKDPLEMSSFAGQF